MTDAAHPFPPGCFRISRQPMTRTCSPTIGTQKKNAAHQTDRPHQTPLQQSSSAALRAIIREAPLFRQTRSHKFFRSIPTSGINALNQSPDHPAGSRLIPHSRFSFDQNSFFRTNRSGFPPTANPIDHKQTSISASEKNSTFRSKEKLQFQLYVFLKTGFVLRASW